MSKREDWADAVQSQLAGALAPTPCSVAEACLAAHVPEVVAFLLGWQSLPTNGVHYDGNADEFAASYAAGVTLRWRLREARMRLVGTGARHAS